MPYWMRRAIKRDPEVAAIRGRLAAALLAYRLLRKETWLSGTLAHMTPVQSREIFTPLIEYEEWRALGRLMAKLEAEPTAWLQ